MVKKTAMALVQDDTKWGLLFTTNSSHSYPYVSRTTYSQSNLQFLIYNFKCIFRRLMIIIVSWRRKIHQNTINQKAKKNW